MYKTRPNKRVYQYSLDYTERYTHRNGHHQGRDSRVTGSGQDGTCIYFILTIYQIDVNEHIMN